MFADFGGRYGARLSEKERLMLQTSDVAYLAAQDALAATEEPLIAFARSWLWEHGELLRREPLYAVLLDPMLGGRRAAALELAAWLGFNFEPGDEAATVNQRQAM
jgi:hypothetical protein